MTLNSTDTRNTAPLVMKYNLMRGDASGTGATERKGEMPEMLNRKK